MIFQLCLLGPEVTIDTVERLQRRGRRGGSEAGGGERGEEEGEGSYNHTISLTCHGASMPNNSTVKCGWLLQSFPISR